VEVVARVVEIMSTITKPRRRSTISTRGAPSRLTDCDLSCCIERPPNAIGPAFLCSYDLSLVRGSRERAEAASLLASYLA
jgi:hypothetical protein